MPDPREELISRVAGGTDRTSFSWSGRESVRELERTLAIIDRSLDSFESILDFGCGGLDAPLASTGDDGLRSAATCPGLLWDCRTMSYSSGDLTAHDRVSRSLPAQGCVRMKYLPTAYETLSEARGLTAISRARSGVARS
jgi:hypothetical protein